MSTDVRNCIGYKGKPDKCPNIATYPPKDPFWCSDCDKVRRDLIDKAFERLQGADK